MRHDLQPEGLLRPLDKAADESIGNKQRIVPPTGLIVSPESTVSGPDVSILGIRNNCSAPELLSVTLSLELEANTQSVPLEGVFVWPHLQAVIGFGAGGVSQQAIVDVKNGTRVSVVADNLDVSVRYLLSSRPWSPTNGANVPTFFVGAAVGYGAVEPNSHGSTYTHLVQLEDGGATEDVVIPAFATSFSVLPVNDQDVTVQILGFGGGYNVNMTFEGSLTNVGQYNVENATPIPNGARFLRVRPTADVATFAFIVFGLSI